MEQTVEELQFRVNMLYSGAVKYWREHKYVRSTAAVFGADKREYCDRLVRNVMNEHPFTYSVGLNKTAGERIIIDFDAAYQKALEE